MDRCCCHIPSFMWILEAVISFLSWKNCSHENPFSVSSDFFYLCFFFLCCKLKWIWYTYSMMEFFFCCFHCTILFVYPIFYGMLKCDCTKTNDLCTVCTDISGHDYFYKSFKTMDRLPAHLPSFFFHFVGS